MAVTSERNFSLQDIYCKKPAAKCGLVRKAITAVAESSYHCGCDKTPLFFYFLMCTSFCGWGEEGIVLTVIRRLRKTQRL